MEGLFGGDNTPPVVIAEIGANHDGDLGRAHRMVDAVADAGARCAKFQLYTVEELVADPEAPVSWGPPERRQSETMGSMFGRIALPVSAIEELFAHARERDLVPFSSCFSEEGVDTLLRLGAPLLKIAASDVTHLPLLRHAAATGLPVILSLGKCTLSEADDAVTTLEAAGVTELALLHCVASYPSPMEDLNLRVIPMLKAAFPDRTIGFSDHSIGVTAPVAAVALGARIVEKHVTMDRSLEGPDHWFSLDMEELERLVEAVGDAQVALGSSRKSITPSEALGRSRGLRSITASRDLPAGRVLSHEDVRIVRPGGGLSPAHLGAILGMEIKVDVGAMKPLRWEHFKPGSEVEHG